MKRFKVPAVCFLWLFFLGVCGAADLPKHPRELHPAVSPGTPGDGPLLIFVSFSLPGTSLRRILREAARTDAVLVLRGLVEASLPRTAERLRELLERARPELPVAGEPAWVIDPFAYRRFAVTGAPLFVLCLEPLATCHEERCPAPRHVRLAGDLHLDEVLKQFAAIPEARSRALVLRRRLERSP